jgi:hypothetical protein
MQRRLAFRFAFAVGIIMLAWLSFGTLSGIWLSFGKFRGLFAVLFMINLT